MSFVLKTTAFVEGGTIPKQYTCSGADLSPALSWEGAPAKTQSFALIADDPDAPVGTWTHWVIWNIAGTSLPDGVAKLEELPNGMRQGRNDFKRAGYGGPCPPPGKPHRYFFRLYALDSKLHLSPGASKSDLEQTMQGHILAQAQLMGTFGR
jgi:Raf kinase inhibitor-like YbhB/YbcL family protein